MTSVQWVCRATRSGCRSWSKSHGGRPRLKTSATPQCFDYGLWMLVRVTSWPSDRRWQVDRRTSMWLWHSSVNLLVPCITTKKNKQKIRSLISRHQVPILLVHQYYVQNWTSDLIWKYCTQKQADHAVKILWTTLLWSSLRIIKKSRKKVPARKKSRKKCPREVSVKPRYFVQQVFSVRTFF